MESSERNFSEAVREIVAHIPEGLTLSYGVVAERAGFPGSARAVGSFLRQNHDSGIPCHRVIRGCGRIGTYNRGGEDGKAKLLKQEGVPLDRKIRAGKSTWSVSRMVSRFANLNM
ncbi:MAG: MGMT family protein [Candidatus Moranbacteria bacterium]|nr:MGMT family protein [Candidatus Moranbacteria bacterium]